MGSWSIIFRLGTKELLSLLRDTTMLVFIVWSFTFAITSKSQVGGEAVNNASIGIVDEDRSALAGRITGAFFPPWFQAPEEIGVHEIDRALDAGRFMFVLVIPSGFEREVAAGRTALLQLHADATAASQASLGTGYITEIVEAEVARFVGGSARGAAESIELVTRRAYNQAGIAARFGAIVALLDQITMLAIILTGAALLREREHGTIEHLLTMPLSAFQIAFAKVWANGSAILVCSTLSLLFVVRAWLGVPIGGSLALLLGGTAVYLFAASSIGLFLGTVARSMAQFALLVIIVILPMQMLSGGSTPIENQPDFVQPFSWLLPSRHFMAFGQAVAFRDAGLVTVWPELLTIAALGTVCLAGSLALFRRSLSRST